MQQAAALAGGDLLLFTDADIIHEPRALATGLAELDNLGLDFLSLFPADGHNLALGKHRRAHVRWRAGDARHPGLEDPIADAPAPARSS